MTQHSSPPATQIRIWPWRALYWEPVAGTGERIMVGVLHGFEHEYKAVRTIRNDVLDCLFGKAAPGLRRLIEHSLKIFEVAATASNSLELFSAPVSGIHPGPVRATEAQTENDLLHTACLLYSSLGNLDKLDESEEADAPQQEEVNRRFGSEVKQEVLNTRPDLSSGFGRSATLIHAGMAVKFGFLSAKTILHFTVLHPVRQSASMRDARARIFELQRAREISGIGSAALIAATPRDDDATLGTKQREVLKANRLEIEYEADAVDLSWFAVNSALQGAQRVIEIAG